VKTSLSLLSGSSLALAALVAMVACEGSSDNGSSSGGGAFDAGASMPPDSGTTTDSSAADASVVIDCPTPTGGPTMHAGNVMATETWTAAGSPHILDSNVNVRDGATLTIEPCAQVQLAKDVRLNVAYPLTPNTGTLIAEGSPTHPIRFSGKSGERWDSVYVVAPGTARLKYVTLEGGGGVDTLGNGSTIEVVGDSTLPADPTILLDHVTIKGSTGAGLTMRAGATFLPGSAELVVTGSGSVLSPYPVRIEEHSMDRLPTGTLTGNKKDEINLTLYGGGIAGDGLLVDATLHDRGVPYHVDGNFGIGRLGAPLATMTIEPGVTMKFEANRLFSIQRFTGSEPAAAALIAVGTAAKPIVFTSASPTPAAGDWVGLWYGGALDASNKLDHVRIEYAGGDCLCSMTSCSDITYYNGALILTNVPAKAFITNSTFLASAGHGITEGFVGNLVNFRPTNTFTSVAGCAETLPKFPSPQSCSMPLPACDGL
jgi:hypothetical protein